jgi:hypothetical protein
MPPPDEESGGPETPATSHPIKTTSCHTGEVTGKASRQVAHVTDIPGWAQLAAWLKADKL